MYKKAVLHVGYDKSGSTALQTAATSLRAHLLQYGINYPQPICNHSHSLLASVFHPDPIQAISNRGSARATLSAAEIRRQDKQFLKHYDSLIAGGSGTLLLSFEGFIWLSAEEHDHLRNWILNHARQVQVLVYVREPVSYTESAISQRVRTGRPIELSFHRHNFTLPNLIDVYGRGSVMVQNCDRKSLRGGSIRHDCFSLLGLETEQIKHLTRQLDNTTRSSNKSLSMHGIGIGEALRNALEGTDFLEGAGFQQRFVAVFDEVLHAIPGPRYHLSSKERNSLLNQSEVVVASNYLHQEFGIDFRKRPAWPWDLSFRKRDRLRSQFDALRQQGEYARFASTLVEQLAPRIRAAEECLRSGLDLESFHWTDLHKSV